MANLRLTIAIIGIAVLLVAAPARGRISDEDFDIARLIGWMQATCAFGEDGHISPQIAKAANQSTLKALSKRYGKDLALRAANLNLRKYPHCQPFVPATYLPE